MKKPVSGTAVTRQKNVEDRGVRRRLRCRAEAGPSGKRVATGLTAFQPGRSAEGRFSKRIGGRVSKTNVVLVRLPFLLPLWADAQVLIPRRIFLGRRAQPSLRLLAHELVHVEQLERMGMLRYWWTYLVLLLRCGYREHPMELDAIVRSAEPRFLDWARDLLRRTPAGGAARTRLGSSRSVDVR